MDKEKREFLITVVSILLFASFAHNFGGSATGLAFQEYLEGQGLDVVEFPEATPSEDFIIVEPDIIVEPIKPDVIIEPPVDTRTYNQKYGATVFSRGVQAYRGHSDFRKALEDSVPKYTPPTKSVESFFSMGSNAPGEESHRSFADALRRAN